MNKDGIYNKKDIALAKNIYNVGDLLNGQKDLNNDGVIDKKDKNIIKDIKKIQKTLEKQNKNNNTNKSKNDVAKDNQLSNFKLNYFM